VITPMKPEMTERSGTLINSIENSCFSCFMPSAAKDLISSRFQKDFLKLILLDPFLGGFLLDPIDP